MGQVELARQATVARAQSWSPAESRQQLMVRFPYALGRPLARIPSFYNGCHSDTGPMHFARAMEKTPRRIRQSWKAVCFLLHSEQLRVPSRGSHEQLWSEAYTVGFSFPSLDAFAA